MTGKLTLYGLIFSAGVAVGGFGLPSCNDGPNQTKVKVSDKPIPKELTEEDVTIPNPDELVVFDGLSGRSRDQVENEQLRREAQRLRQDLEAIADRSVVEVVNGRTHDHTHRDSLVEPPTATIAQLCTRAVETRARVGLSPLFQANAGINVLLAVFAREQQTEAGFADNRRFGLLPIDVITSNPVIDVTSSRTVLRWWDPLNAAWLQSTYRHRRERRPILYAGAGTIVNEGGVSYGPAASIDVHAGRLRLSAEGVLDAFNPDNSVAMATAQLGF